MAPRLDSQARKRAILDAALPIFARKGFAATTTREIAQAAGVSEALIFKHFPSKASLYEAIFLSCIDGDPEYERLVSLPPSTDTLVQMVQGLVSYFVIELPADPNERARHRLSIISLLEDGEFMRQVFKGIRSRFLPCFAASIEAAIAVGDLVPGPVDAENGFWLAEHLCEMMATVCLSGGAIVPYPCDRPDLARQTIWFILRGLGLSDTAIAAHERGGRFPFVPSQPPPAHGAAKNDDPTPERPE
ncbi:AcrR family transcriptional regulator [Azospirillum lipoferum]|uniref:TetR/AcrR family transcriptional regulator n=1 Tax=Azospirillum lipoferum TaxID=193 RepID=A0A5A9GSW8_AZOLI|nr:MULTISPECIES: TetR/AcrR family transcriptional regulator [Azospirillum]KAA0596439.1 TetR/AcrR family transcriptional regulator [Azospirillum lipoferum]MCP1610427.1 AcrR family transcriptional regulator [Azospirillum lipoferum]MDW5538129.1 TetR/AcrR family transcriptional regulator [Azospirillum sp. NL1]